LFGGKGVQFGNKISEDGGNKSRRKWRPNVVKKNLYSEALGESFKLSITTHVLRCIKKHGSFDQYLLRTTDKNLASPLGSELKRRVRAALEAKQVLEQIQQDPQQQQ
jgi:large subunit ribosomal protein L28